MAPATPAAHAIRRSSRHAGSAIATSATASATPDSAAKS